MSQQQYPSLSLQHTSTGELDSPAGSANIKAYELKGFMFSMLTMCLKHLDVQAIEQQLMADIANVPDFSNEPLVVDFHNVSAMDVAPDFPALFTMMYRLNLTPVGICNGNETQKEAARGAGVPVLAGGATAKRRPAAKEQSMETRASDTPPEANKAQLIAEPPATHIVHAPVRTGQRVFSAGDITLLAAVNAGAEVLAAGSIHVYGPLRGRALAGVAGDRKARIFTKCMEAELVSIAGNFRVLENELDKDVQGKPAQIFLDGERIVIKPL